MLYDPDIFASLNPLNLLSTFLMYESFVFSTSDLSILLPPAEPDSLSFFFEFSLESSGKYCPFNPNLSWLSIQYCCRFSGISALVESNILRYLSNIELYFSSGKFFLRNSSNWK